MIRFLADGDFNHAIVSGSRRKEPAIDFLLANGAKLKDEPREDSRLNSSLMGTCYR